jgi:tetratricopeptide (TPR) repeat protein
VDYRAILERIRQTVDQDAYLPLADAVPSTQRDAMAEVQRALQQGDAAGARQRAAALHEAGRIDAVLYHSALHVIAASPQVRDFAEAAQQVALQELAAWQAGGASLATNLASVDRHRGVLAFLARHYDVALDYFSRAFEREHSAGNLANVLSTLIRLGEESEARELLVSVRSSFPVALRESLAQMIALDPDLALLRDPETP